MTVMTEQQITLPAWQVEQGDFVYDAGLDDWQYVESVRHYQNSLGWHVTLVLAKYPGIAPDAPRPMRVLTAEAEVQISRS